MPPEVQVYNTMGRSKQAFTPRQPGRVSMYTCGPTVYKYAHIGNFRTYLMSDFWIRGLRYLGFDVTQVENITDVGHLLDDADDGEDKVLQSAQREGKSPEEIADFYTAAFMSDAALLRVRPPDHQPRATEFVPQMIEAIARLEAMGLAYAVDGSVYYDVERRGDYPKLSGNTLDQLHAGYRVEVDQRKRNSADFALWKAAGERRLQVWDSPWGRGFPGWHIECTAMSLHHFPQGFDIHTGGVDNIFPHHEDEIAQSEPLVGGPVANYWIHGEFLTGDGGRKMAKSAGNILRVAELEELGYEPLAFRYLCLTARYRTKLSFTEEALDGAQTGLRALRRRASRLAPATPLATDAGRAFEARFSAALADDLDLPLVSALLQEVLRADIPEGEKRQLLESWDAVLQVDLTRPEAEAGTAIPAEALALARARDEARAARDWARADSLRGELAALGFVAEDSPEGTRLRRA
ncbi:MAG TPA: cysteine--tRNA ligase [Candidatus Dormibacteraeota bacterium]|jgi:cysteinyl-tRNA synthetase|nr:cysteine--tRNA ligase [Candidatus Dormibacteraeota bacterium]